MIVSVITSILSIIVGIVIISIFGKGMETSGSFIILAILGAPLTFLHRIFWIFDRSNIPLYGMYSLYFLQYQLIAFGIYKYHDKLNLKIYCIGIAIIIISAIIMYCFQMGKFS